MFEWVCKAYWLLLLLLLFHAVYTAAVKHMWSSEHFKNILNVCRKGEVKKIKIKNDGQQTTPKWGFY